MACEPLPSPRIEAEALARLVARGLETAQSVRALLRVSRSQARHVGGAGIVYRARVRVEFENILRPGSASLPAPAPPSPAPPRTLSAEEAITKALAELMAPAAPVQAPQAPMQRRGPYRKRVPPEFASAAISRVARSFGVPVADLITPRRGPRPDAGVPRWTAVLLLRQGGMVMREVVDALGYADPAGPYLGLACLARARLRDPELDRRIAMLVRETGPGPEPHNQATQSAAR